MPQQSQRVVQGVLIGAAFLAGVDLFIVNVAFDQIGRDFSGTTLSELSWVLNAYAVVYAALLVPMGRLADRVGQKRGFIAGMCLFIAASLACGFAPGIWWLVAFRAVQAVGAAAMTPASLGLLLAAVPAEDRARSARVWALTGAVAAALGPALGGGLVQLSWQWAFWINLPVGLLLVAGAIRYVPDVRHNLGTPFPDLLGSLLLAVPAFRWANISTLVFNSGFGASLLCAILWMQQSWEYGALQTGLAIAIGPLAVPVTSVLAHRWFPRARPGRMIAAGSLLFAGSALWQAAALSTTPAYLTNFLPAWILGGVGVGLAMPNLLAAATATLPPAQSSTGGGVVSTARQVGLALGITLLVTIVSGTDPEADFRLAWCAIAACMVLAAVTALRMARVTVAPAPPPAPSGHRGASSSSAPR